MQYKVIFQAFLDSYANNIRAVIIVRDKYACAQCCIISRVHLRTSVCSRYFDYVYRIDICSVRTMLEYIMCDR